MKNIKKSAKITIANLASIQNLSDAECQKVYGGVGVIQEIGGSSITVSHGITVNRGIGTSP